MLQAIVYNLCLLLIISSCAKKKQGVSCANPDPATGACLRDETSTADPNDIEAILEQALQSQKNMNRELQRLKKEKADLEEQIARGQRPPSDGGLVDTLGQTIIKINEQGAQKGYALSSAPEVDTSKVPAVMLRLENKNDTGVRPTFSFNHTEGVTGIEVNYGGQGNSHVFNFTSFLTKMQLEVLIPLELRFKFNDKQLCARIELSKDFESTKALLGHKEKPMTVGDC